MTYTIAIEKAGDYQRQTIEQSIRRVLAPLGGMGSFINPGERVLLKPNMLAGKAPEKAVTTHPEVVRTVIELVKEAGGIPLVGDSPGVGGLKRVAEKSGILAVVEETGAELVEFSEAVEINGSGMFKKFALAAPYLAADRVINLPKLKTHEMLTMTCAVKNLFGAVVGTSKAAWHLKAGTDRALFARMLLEICLYRVPDLNIVDAVTAMEGDGPGSGDPKHVGLIIAGADPVAVDVVAARIAGIPKKFLYLERAAEELGHAGSNLANISIAGLSMDEAKATPFRLPHISDVQFGLPPFLKNRLRHYLTSRPTATPDCKLCNICVAACPPKAMEIKGGKLIFDYHRCIRCFCCRELCPEGALDVTDGKLLKILKKFV